MSASLKTQVCALLLAEGFPPSRGLLLGIQSQQLINVQNFAQLIRIKIQSTCTQTLSTVSASCVLQTCTASFVPVHAGACHLIGCSANIVRITSCAERQTCIVRNFCDVMAGSIMFDFSGVKDNGHNMNSQDCRIKMHLLEHSTATFHEKVKLGESLHQIVYRQLVLFSLYSKGCIFGHALIILHGAYVSMTSAFSSLHLVVRSKPNSSLQGHSRICLLLWPESGGVKETWKRGDKVKVKPVGRAPGAKPMYGTLEYFYFSGELASCCN